MLLSLPELIQQAAQNVRRIDAATAYAEGQSEPSWFIDVREPGEVADHTAAKGYDHVVALDLLFQQPLDGAGQVRPGLRALARRKPQGNAGYPLLRQRILEHLDDFRAQQTSSPHILEGVRQLRYPITGCPHHPARHANQARWREHAVAHEHERGLEVVRDRDDARSKWEEATRRRAPVEVDKNARDGVLPRSGTRALEDQITRVRVDIGRLQDLGERVDVDAISHQVAAPMSNASIRDPQAARSR